MVFSSTIFLFLFLPLTLICYLLAGRRFRNALLLIASLVFYIWGENIYVLVMLSSITVNYIFGLLIDRSMQKGDTGRRALVAGLVANIGLLVFFKYANFIIENINIIFSNYDVSIIEMEAIHLPIGISFFTFQAMSYIIDIYRQQSAVQKNPVNLGLYISLFPQLIAGPIVRYHDIASQIRDRRTKLSDFAAGSERFVFGLGKKVLIANPLAAMADSIFVLPFDQLSAGTAWLGIICYTLQIYFDFSGYSDMAIGLGRMFGFRFLENFNYPYISRSIREFWRRWHISLSSWFRDYLYIPLGGNRRGDFRTGVNLLTVFLLCGLWHGASWNFIIWGLLHGIFLVLERGVPGKILSGLPMFIQHIYALFVVINAWVFFRLEELSDAMDYLAALYGASPAASMYPYVVQNLDAAFLLSLCAGLILAMPVYPSLRRTIVQKMTSGYLSSGSTTLIYGMRFTTLTSVLIFSTSSIAVGSYNPFIYFRF